MRQIAKAFAALFASLFLAIAFAVPAAAQSTPGIQPLEMEADENQVDLLSGKVRMPTPELSVPAGSNLKMSDIQELLPLLKGTILGSPIDPDHESNYQINNGTSISENFNCFDFDCTSVKGNGSAMFESGGNYATQVYYERGSGRKIFFDVQSSLIVNGSTKSVTQYPSSIVYPNGETLTFTLDPKTSPGVPGVTYYRPTRVESNLGYELQLTYLGDDFIDGSWGTVSQAAIYKSTDTSNALAKHDYAGNTVTDLLGRTWDCSRCGNILGAATMVPQASMKLPTMASNTYQADSSQVQSGGATFTMTTKVTRDGAVYDYAYQLDSSAPILPGPGGPKIDKITVTGPDNFSRVADIAHPQIANAWPPIISKITNGLGQGTSYSYDVLYSRLTKVTMPEGNSVEVIYDVSGNIIEKRSKAKPGSNLGDIVEKADYTASQICMTVSCFRPNWTEDAKGNRTDYTWASHGGLLTALAPADANGVRSKTINEYTAAGGITRLTKTRTCSETSGGGNLTCGTADEVVKEISYWNDTFLPLTETATNGTGSISAVTTYSYDDAGRVLSVDGPLAGNGDTSYFRYDILGRKTWEIAPKGANGKHITTRTTYRDADDQVTKVEKGTLTSPSDTNLVVLDTIETEYNDRRLAVKTTAKGDDNVIQSVTQASYDARNMPLCSAVRMNPALFANPPADACTHGTAGTQGNDRIAKTIYDVLGRPTEMRNAVGKPLEQATVSYTYTTNGQKATVTDANGNKASYEYDGFDRLSKWFFPHKTIAGTSSTTDYEQYGYDANGNRISLRKRDGLVINYTYDAVNRMTVKAIPAKPGVAAIHTRDVYYDYDFRGLQTKARFDSLTGPGVDNAYDVLGRMTSSTNRMFSTPLELTYLYDIAGRRTRITHDDGEYFRYYYYKVGPAAKIRENNDGWLKIGYYNDRGQMWRNVRGSGMVSKSTFDAIGRVASMQIILPGTASDNVFGFGYNPASQMVNRTTSNDLYANTAHYDVDRGYQVNGLNQYTQAGPAAFQYDDNGNLTNDGSVTFTYDVENRLVAASGARTAELIYDPLGRLWEINAGTNASKQRLLYDGDAMVAEYDYLGNITQRYVHDNGADQPLVWYEGGQVNAASRRHLYNNWQGSITAITDSAGTAIGVNAYDAYGIPNDTNIGRFQYTGQMWIPELGLYHYKARAYSPTLGRFMQTDPIGYEDQVNLYAYVGNDPVGNVDPSGKCYLCVDTTELTKDVDREAAAESLEDVKEFLFGDIIAAVNNPTAGNIAKAGISLTPAGKGVKIAKGILKGMKLTEAKRLLKMWSKRTYRSRAASVRDHAARKGFDSVPKYLRKAANFNKKGARTTRNKDGTTTYRRNDGEYLITDENGKVVSYGQNFAKTGSRIIR